jgi:hypothetical protein
MHVHPFQTTDGCDQETQKGQRKKEKRREKRGSVGMGLAA